MDLDQLKDMWQKQPVNADAVRNEKQLAELLTRQSKSPITKMRRNMLMELIILLVCFGGVAIFYFIAFKGRMSEISWLYILMILLFGGYLYKKNQLLNNIECTTCHVKSNLELQVSMLDKYMRFYLWAGTLMIPVLFIFLGWVFYTKEPSDTEKIIFFHSPAYPGWQTMLSWVVLGLVITIPVYFLNKKYIYKLYGKHVDRLRRILTDMDEAG